MELTIEIRKSLAAVRDAGFKFGSSCADDTLIRPVDDDAIAVYLANGEKLVADCLDSGILPRLSEALLHSRFRRSFGEGFAARLKAMRN